MERKQKTDENNLTPAEWKKINPGKGQPTVKHENGLEVVTYPDGTTVTCHRDMGTVNLGLIIGGIMKIVTLPVSVVWKLHGEPCEKRSRQNGGDGYPKTTEPKKVKNKRK